MDDEPFGDIFGGNDAEEYTYTAAELEEQRKQAREEEARAAAAIAKREKRVEVACAAITAYSGDDINVLRNTIQNFMSGEMKSPDLRVYVRRVRGAVLRVLERAPGDVAVTRDALVVLPLLCPVYTNNYDAVSGDETVAAIIAAMTHHHASIEVQRAGWTAFTAARAAKVEHGEHVRDNNSALRVLMAAVMLEHVTGPCFVVDAKGFLVIQGLLGGWHIQSDDAWRTALTHHLATFERAADTPTRTAAYIAACYMSTVNESSRGSRCASRALVRCVVAHALAEDVKARMIPSTAVINAYDMAGLDVLREEGAFDLVAQLLHEDTTDNPNGHAADAAAEFAVLTAPRLLRTFADEWETNPRSVVHMRACGLMREMMEWLARVLARPLDGADPLQSASNVFISLRLCLKDDEGIQWINDSPTILAALGACIQFAVDSSRTLVAQLRPLLSRVFDDGPAAGLREVF